MEYKYIKKTEKTIEKIQKYCLRSIAKETRNSHTDPLFKLLKIMKFDDIIRLEQSKLAYKIKNRLMPIPILELFNTLGKKMHRYNTRERHLLNIKKHKSELYNKNFLCKSITYYNELSSTNKKYTQLIRICKQIQKGTILKITIQ